MLSVKEKYKEQLVRNSSYEKHWNTRSRCEDDIKTDIRGVDYMAEGNVLYDLVADYLIDDAEIFVSITSGNH